MIGTHGGKEMKKGLSGTLRLLALGMALSGGACAAEDIVLDKAMHEEVVMIPSTHAGVRLETTIFKPNGAGPFPIVVMNHGKAPGNSAFQPRSRYLVIAREFLERGYAVIIPMRQGFSASGGLYIDGGCNIESNGNAQADDVQAALDYAQKQPWADRDNVVVMGQSHGGLTTLAYGARNPAHVKALVNFAGGLRKDAFSCQWQYSLIDAFESYGAATKIPSLWFYGANDSYFAPEVVQQLYAAYTRHHADAKLIAYGPFKQDSHGMSSSIDGLPIWWPETEALLQRVGLPTKRLFVATDYGELPVTAPASNADVVPYVKQNGREGYARFLNAKLPRAFAISESGAWGSAIGGNYTERALQNCQSHSQVPCHLYAVNQSTVWASTENK